MATRPEPLGASPPDASNASAGSLSATTLAQFVRLESCERYLWYRLHVRETLDLLRAWRLTEQPLTPLLSEKGALHEEGITKDLEDAGNTLVDLAGRDVGATVDELRHGLAEPRVLLQAAVEGRI